MKAVILAGGRGTRLLEETQFKPKPLVNACGKPLIWHIMQNFAMYDINEFYVLSGYNGHQIREYFANFWIHQSDITFDLMAPDQQILKNRGLPWKVTVLDTGVDTKTGDRISYLREILKEDFILTYGDGVADVDISRLIASHQSSKNFISLTAVQPPARFGALELSNDQVKSFKEKPIGDGAWVNGGFFVISPVIFDYLNESNLSFESDVLPKIATIGKLGAYRHGGFWQPVDTIRDLQRLEEAINLGKLPWA
jgi:glucose-1-phosphate cytidylyltransferase